MPIHACFPIQNNKNLFSIMSNLQTHYHLY